MIALSRFWLALGPLGPILAYRVALIVINRAFWFGSTDTWARFCSRHPVVAGFVKLLRAEGLDRTMAADAVRQILERTTHASIPPWSKASAYPKAMPDDVVTAPASPQALRPPRLDNIPLDPDQTIPETKGPPT